MSEKIAIIVPIYNVEKYLPCCLDSILSQSYSNLEVMLVNDGSPDGSGKICDEYAAKDSRIRVFHNENQGVAKARQYGVENSTSDYIVFADPDDWLTKDAVKTLYNALTTDVDIVLGAAIEHRKQSVKRQTPIEKEFYPEEYLTAILTHGVKVTPWAKIYRKSLFKKDSFPNFTRGQDWLMNASLATDCRKAKSIAHYTYNYRVNSESSSNNHAIRTFKKYEDFCLCIKDILSAKGLYDNNLEMYAKLLFKSIAHAPFKGVKIDYQSPLIAELFENLNYNSLSFKHKLKYIVLKHRFLSNTIAYIKR